MKLVAQLEEFLQSAKSAPNRNDLGIRGWRILVHEASVLSIGIKENSPGSVYTPPSYRQGESGDIYIIWEDGRLTQAQVQVPHLQSGIAYWQMQLEEWRQASYEDPEGADIPQPEPIPIVTVEDREIERILAGEDDLLFEQLARLLKDIPQGINLNASIQAGWGYRHVRNSKGLAVSYQQSQYALSYSFDSLVGAGFAKRRLISPEEWTKLWKRTNLYYEALQDNAPEISAKTVVVFSPSVVGSFLGQFIFPNLIGQSILEGQSAFKVEEFKTHKVVFHEDLDLYVDPLRPLEWGSYLLTPEGVPAKKTVLIKNGSLQTPILRMKDAKKWGAPTTGISSGTSGLYLESRQGKPWEEALSGIEDGILILSVLGMHTQNSASGDYSLSAPQSLRILKGKIAGKRDVKLNGNFFKDLASLETILGQGEIETKPYMVVRTGVQNM
ncbi:putative Zn-dependent protease-like protein [Desulfitobacterium dichloroeliminans LMG P-21439]|uniref:Putative Zn-dependent protease-like protein n=1 Tax=Desulfitobacterium dichloroeliminans (strain LMG P-21439 / DCA1) TaxID=871963 RepID=L0F8T4_DESDL|nr:metallopeptidase TldD-related protein [Desulfitobacterium dichloroeliminans]AGA70239.1 putative Zn-dependent protease-like protein [Desulfitobacterium dichloroeliminans LMG P-21439]